MKYKILKLAFIVWIALWAHFIVRELFWKGSFYDYKTLLSRSLDGKRSYVTGEGLYEFLAFCAKTLPRGATYGFMGLDKESIDIKRAEYYLYPGLKRDDPEFILVYDCANAVKAGYEMFAKLDDKRYMLRKVR